MCEELVAEKCFMKDTLSGQKHNNVCEKHTCDKFYSEILEIFFKMMSNTGVFFCENV